MILYTSDHGQSLLEGGYKLSHCSVGNVHPGEAIVPILAFASDGPFRQRLQEQAQQHMSKATHFDIFPTLLIAMGFDSGWVAKHYDASLLALPPARQRRFLVGDMFGAGKGVKWIDVK